MGTIPSFKGQWTGVTSGTNTGTVIANFDEMATRYQGVAYHIDDNAAIPGAAVFFQTEDKSTTFKFRALTAPIDPMTGVVNTWENIKQQFHKDVRFPEYVDVTGSVDGNLMKLAWISSNGTNGEFALKKSAADQPSELVPKEYDWAAYKNYIATLEGKRFLFRGQNNQWRLRTSFHRTGRADLNRFLQEDIPALHRHLSARTKHVFNLQIPEENGAFFNLVQHHGYPTPLLDWTYSPYVAAFFGFYGLPYDVAECADAKQRVRIHILDQAQWKTDWAQLRMLLTAGPHLSIGEYMAIENERMIPQQAASTVTNVDDIETYVSSKSKQKNGKEYLWAIDLPVSERKKVIQELSFMGITAGSLFPGLDGACKELRERNFDL